MSQTQEISLDPEDWSEFSQLAHRALDAAIDHMRGARERLPWQPVPEAARQDIEGPIPRHPGDPQEIFARFERSILPFPTGNAHPRFWGWVMGNGTPDAMLGDMLAAAMNPHLAGYDQSAAVVERQVIRWCIELMGYPPSASGLLVSGGTMASLTGLAVARRVKAGFDVREQGLAGGPRLRVYGSVETHSWAEKCCDVLGLGRDAVRRVAADREGRVVPQALREAIREDRRRGDRPICVIGNAGTVDTGAIDDLDALADLCQEEDLWLHVDGAFGALIALAPSLRDRLSGLERSDSLALDLHKWGYLQYELGCVLVRDREAHRATFETQASYLVPPGRGLQPEALDLAELGVQLSRGFRALKVWVSLQTHGVERIGRTIEQNVDQAAGLSQRIEADPHLELLAPVTLNVVCFRYLETGLEEPELEALNREILLRLQEDGIAIPSSTWREGRFALRVAITNHRTRRSDIDVLVDAVLALGRELAPTAGTT
ncbi:MAG: pyridoxal-dependent decarboxylase [Acidobacteriota bacterium]